MSNSDDGEHISGWALFFGALIVMGVRRWLGHSVVLDRRRSEVDRSRL